MTLPREIRSEQKPAHSHTVSGKTTSLTGLHSHVVDMSPYVDAIEALQAQVAEIAGGPVVPIPVPPVTGPVFYVSPTGSDTGTGSQASPWRSVQTFINTNPPAGSTLYLRGGSYLQSQGGLTARDTYGSLIGTAAAPITIRNMPGEPVSFPNLRSYAFAFWPNEQTDRIGASHVVLEGIGFPGVAVDDEAAIVVGGAEPSKYLVNHITLRNLTGSIVSTSRSVDHIIGLIRGCEDITLEDSTFSGTGQGDAFVIYDQPAALRTIIRRSTFTDFPRLAIQVWDYATPAVAGIAIESCAFRRNVRAIDLRYHAASSVTDCTFDVPAGPAAVYDPYHASLTTLARNTYA